MQLQRGEFVISLDDGWIRFAAASHQVMKPASKIVSASNLALLLHHTEHADVEYRGEAIS